MSPCLVDPGNVVIAVASSHLSWMLHCTGSSERKFFSTRHHNAASGLHGKPRTQHLQTILGCDGVLEDILQFLLNGSLSEWPLYRPKRGPPNCLNG